MEFFTSSENIGWLLLAPSVFVVVLIRGIVMAFPIPDKSQGLLDRVADALLCRGCVGATPGHEGPGPKPGVLGRSPLHPKKPEMA